MRVISQKLRDSARGQDCTLRLDCCNFNSETTVLAHVPCNQRGTGMKGPDQIAIFCCSACHDRVDARDSSNGVIDPWDIIRALAETQMFWIEKGLMKIEGMKRK